MRPTFLLASIAGAAAFSAIASASSPVRSPTTTLTRVQPCAIATVRRVNGQLVRTSDWVPFRGSTSRESGILVFDCFQPGDAHEPIDGGCDDQPPDLPPPNEHFRVRYAPFLAEDMTFDPAHGGATITEYSLAWSYQVIGGTPVDTSFAIAIFTYNEMIDNVDCSSTTVGVFPNDFTPASDGFIANYGQLPQGYWYSNIDGLNDLGVLMPDGESGTYEQVMLWVDDISGDLSIPPDNCGPFFWGTSDDGGLPNRPGTQDRQVYLDDGGVFGGKSGTPDGAYDPHTECYDMSWLGCPNPVGNMAAFWVKAGCGCCARCDHDGDGFITGLDYDLFVADFEAGCMDDTPPCTNSADYDENGFVTGVDFDLFVECFENGCL